MVEAAGGSVSAGWLVAEGDSWFNYPWTDILGKLRHEHAYEILSCAHRGDRVEGMAYDDGQLAQFTSNIETVVRQGHLPRAILLSGGGNDIAGDHAIARRFHRKRFVHVIIRNAARAELSVEERRDRRIARADEPGQRAGDHD